VRTLVSTDRIGDDCQGARVSVRTLVSTDRIGDDCQGVRVSVRTLVSTVYRRRLPRCAGLSAHPSLSVGLEGLRMVYGGFRKVHANLRLGWVSLRFANEGS
jgi:hypothetical protein